MSDTRFGSCIKCTVCITICPVSRANPCYPGPKQARSDGERPRLKDGTLYDEALKYCINCKRCEVAYPSDVKVGDVIQRARAQYGQQKPTLRDAIFSHTDPMGILSTPLAPLVNATAGSKPVHRLLNAVLKVNHRCTLPKYGFGTFRRAYRRLMTGQAQYPEQMVFFHGCYANYSRPQLGKDLIYVVNALGASVQLLLREKCCSIPLIANGFFDKAYRQAQNSAVAMRENTLPVIATSSTCTSTLRDEYPHLLDVDNSDLRDWVGLTTHWIWKQLDAGKTLPLRQLPLKVVYHAPCHMEKTGQPLYTFELPRLIPDLQLEVLDSQCCDVTGTYGFKTESYAVSQTISTPLFRQIKESGADIVVTDCEACKWQIEVSIRKRCEYPLAVLAQALA